MTPDRRRHLLDHTPLGRTVPAGPPAAFAFDPDKITRDERGRFAETGAAGNGDPGEARAALAAATAARDAAHAALAAHEAATPAAERADAVGLDPWLAERAAHAAGRGPLAAAANAANAAVYAAEARVKAATDPLPLRGAFASYTDGRDGVRRPVTPLGRLVDAADRGLTGRAADAVDQWVGHTHARLDRGLAGGGFMVQKPLEAVLRDPPATPLDAAARAAIEAAMTPVRAALRVQFGETLPLYRFQGPVAPGAAPRVVLSYTADPAFARWHGAGAAGAVERRDVPVGDVVYVTDRAGQCEFLVRPPAPGGAAARPDPVDAELAAARDQVPPAAHAALVRAVTAARAAGYAVPPFTVRRDTASFRERHGAAWTTVPASVAHAPGRPPELLVNPRYYHAHDPAARAAAGHQSGYASSADPDHVLRHELGHVLHGDGVREPDPDGVGLVELTRRFPDGERDRATARLVSRRAAADGAEFVAELFAARLAGRAFPPAVLALNRRLGGPEPARP